MVAISHSAALTMGHTIRTDQNPYTRTADHNSFVYNEIQLDTKGSKGMIERVQKTAAVLRDIGVIIGVPGILYLGSQLYGLQQQSTQAQIGALKEQIELLKERQYDRAATVLKAQKEVSEAELDAVQRSINVLGEKQINVRDFNNKLLCLNLEARRSEEVDRDTATVSEQRLTAPLSEQPRLPPSIEH